MLQIRLREYSPTGVRGRVLPATDVMFTDPENGAAVLSFALSRKAAGRLGSPFVVGVEYRDGGPRFRPVSRNNLFLVGEESEDDTDVSRTVSFKGESYIPWLMGRNYIWWYGDVKENKRTFGAHGPVSAGEILKYDLGMNQQSGWAPMVTLPFSASKDSNGVAWKPEDKIKGLEVDLPMITGKFLGLLADRGLCEWDTFGLALRVFRPGTTRDLTNLVLDSSRMTRVPLKSSAQELFTNLIVIPDKLGVHGIAVPSADQRFGKLDAVVNQSGMTDQATSVRMAQPVVDMAQRPKREESFEWTPSDGDLLPWRDFAVGDTVTVRTSSEKRARRIIALAVEDRGSGATVRVTVGERLGTPAERGARKLASVSVGGMVGGSGSSFQPATGLPNATPERPKAVRVASNVGVWASDGFTAISEVQLAWDPVTIADDGRGIDIDRYEIWSRFPDGSLSHDTTVTEPVVTVDSWESGRERLVVVYAVSSRGVRSQASVELSVTPKVPSSIVPAAPGPLEVVSNVGSFTAAGPVAAVTLTIPAVTKNTDGGDVTVTEYELWDGDTPLMRVPGSSAKFVMPSDGVKKLRARACSDLGLWGDLGAELTVTGAQPAKVTANPVKPSLVTGSGVVAASWGDAWSGTAPGANVLLRVDVEARIGDAGAWVRQGWLDRAGSTTLKLGAPGETVRVRLIPYDRLNRQMGASEIASIVVAGAGLSDLDKAVTDFLTEMDGKAAAAQSAAADAQAEADRARAAADAAARDASAAGGAASGADAKAKQAKDAADAAQRRADDAFDRAVAAATAAGNAQLATNGKNRLWYQSTQPTGTGHTKDDTWFDTSNGMRISQWDGSKWVTRQLGTAAIQELAITNALIADAAINNAKIANVDAGKITTGFLAAARLAANSITVKKLLVGSFDNLIPDPSMTQDLFSTWSTVTGGNSRWGYRDTSGLPGTAIQGKANSAEARLVSENRVAAKPGMIFSIGLRTYSENWVGTPPALGLVFRNASGAWIADSFESLPVNASSGFADVSRLVTVPNNAGIVYADWEVRIGSGATAGNFMFGKPVWREAVSSELIVDGAIRARHIEAEVGLYEKLFASEFMAGRVKVDHLEPNVGRDLNLSANGAITMIAGRQDSQDEAIAKAQEQADRGVQGVSDASVAAGKAQATADAASGAALVAQSLANQVNDALNLHKTVFIVDQYGAIIAAVDRSNELRMRSTYIAMAQNGVEVTRWEGNRMIVNEAVLNTARIASIKIERYGTGTVIRQV